MLDAIIFDIGNVLLHFDFGRTLKRIAPYCGEDIDLLISGLEPIKQALEGGRISSERFLDEVTALLKYTGSRAELVSAWQQIFDPVQATHRLVERLADFVPLYLLSNTNGLHAEYFLSEWEVFRRFSGAVYSHEAGMMKPDLEIYEHAIAKFGVTPSRTLFVDDLEPNIKSALEAGLQAHHYSAAAHADLIGTLLKQGISAEILGQP